MLMLLFQVGEARWAIAATEVCAVVPNVELQKISHRHSAIVGLLNYHDEILPAIDVSALIGGQPAPPLLSTRIVIVEATLSDRPQKLALVVDRASETIALSEPVNLPMQSPYTQAALKGENGEIIQQLAIAPLLKKALEDASEESLEDSPEAITEVKQGAALEVGVA